MGLGIDGNAKKEKRTDCFYCMKIIAANICTIRYLSELNLSIEYGKQELGHRSNLTVCRFQLNTIQVIYHGEKEKI